MFKKNKKKIFVIKEKSNYKIKNIFQILFVINHIFKYYFIRVIF